MAVEVTNWGRSIVSHPEVVIQVQSVDEIAGILRNEEKYPSPVRAIGSNHSTTQCGVADGGTVVDMTKMNRILDIGTDTVTAEAGALYIDVATELEKRGLQFHVNVELGNLTIGSAACGGTKDASMPGEFGQVCSYAVVIKMVTPTGELLEITEKEPELLKVARSSYGLLGIVYEVTFKTQKIRPMAMYHETYTLDEFIKRLPELTERGESMMLYLFPFLDKVSVEYRKYTDGTRFSKRFVWKIRNWTWKTFAPYFGYWVSKYIAIKPLRYFLVDRLNQLVQWVQKYILKGPGTSPTAQMIRYPDESDNTKYTFSIWAFPEADYPKVLRGYFDFCKTYYREQGYRCNMLNVGYRIFADDSSLFSYSHDGNVLTLDPVATGDPGWNEFIDAYNVYCSDNGGIPLFNQTKAVTPAQSKKAFGSKLDEFRKYQKQYDPRNRLPNEYFKERVL